MEYKGILLDLDQTLANTEDFMLENRYQQNFGVDENTAEYQAYKYLKKHLKIVSWEQFKKEYLNAKKEIKELLPNKAASHNRYLFLQRTLENLGATFNPEIIYEATQKYWNYIFNHMKVFPGVKKFLKNTNRFGIPTAIITDLTADIQNQKLTKLGLSKYIAYMITSEEAGEDKPSPNQLYLALEKLKLNKNEVIIIGNNPKTDIMLAQNNNINSILFDIYRVHENQKDLATHYITDFNEINKILNFHPEDLTNEKLIIFDLIGTLTQYNHIRSELLPKLFNVTLEEVTEPYELYKINEIDKKEFWNRIGIKDYEKAESKLEEQLKLKPEALKLIKKIHKNFKLAILSNVPKEWGKSIISKNNLDKYFESIILSGEVEMIKSKPEIYQILTEKFPKIAPENMYFIDNELEDLLTGKDFLINTIWYRLEEPDAKFIPDYVVNSFEDIDNLLNNL